SVGGLSDGAPDRAGAHRAHRPDLEPSAQGRRLRLCCTAHACLATRTPCLRASAATRRRCDGGRRRQTSQAVSATLIAAGPLKRVRGMAGIVPCGSYLVPGEASEPEPAAWSVPAVLPVLPSSPPPEVRRPPLLRSRPTGGLVAGSR